MLTTPVFSLTQLISPAYAENVFPSWSGWWIGFDVGVQRTASDVSLANTQGFCIAQTAGPGSTASCSISDNEAIAQSHTRQIGAATESIAGAGVVAGNAVSSAAAAAAASYPTDMAVVDTDITFAGGGPGIDSLSSASAAAGAGPSGGNLVRTASTQSVAASSMLSNTYIAYSKSEASGEFGSSSSRALASLGFFDLDTLIGRELNSASVGAHIHYDHEIMDEVLLGFAFGAAVSAGTLTLGKASSIADITFANDSGDFAVSGSSSQKFMLKTDALFNARMRLGRSHDRWMGYVTGGLGWGNFSTSLYKQASVNFHRSAPEVFGSGETLSVQAFAPVMGGGVSFWLTGSAVVSFELLHFFFDEDVHFRHGESITIGNVTTATVKLSVPLQ